MHNRTYVTTPPPPPVTTTTTYIVSTPPPPPPPQTVTVKFLDWFDFRLLNSLFKVSFSLIHSHSVVTHTHTLFVCVLVCLCFCVFVCLFVFVIVDHVCNSSIYTSTSSNLCSSSTTHCHYDHTPTTRCCSTSNDDNCLLHHTTQLSSFSFWVLKIPKHTKQADPHLETIDDWIHGYVQYQIV
jgi:hypothetical protein